MFYLRPIWKNEYHIKNPFFEDEHPVMEIIKTAGLLLLLLAQKTFRSQCLDIQYN